jgi:hypothetical protein
MHKRHFIQAAASGAVTALAVSPDRVAAQHTPAALRGPVLLTVSGLIGTGNRGAIDAALDQMMAKQKIVFTRAHVWDFGALAALPARTVKPTLEYDNKAHSLKGPALMDVMSACGVKISDKTAFFVRAVDGYAAHLPAAEAKRRRFIIATHLDGRPLALGGLGPLWAVYDADRFADMAAKPVNERFVNCPWATYHIEVKE